MDRLSLPLAASLAVLSASPAWSGTITTYSDRSSFNVAVGSTYIDTFDDLPAGDVSSNRIDRNGLTYSALDKGDDYIQLGLFPKVASNDPNDLHLNVRFDASGNGKTDSELLISFDSPVSAFAFEQFDYRGITVTIRFYDGTEFVSSLEFDRDFSTYDFFGYKSSGKDISEVSFTGVPFGAYAAAFDNFTYAIGDADVPEPSTLGLLGLGLLGAATMRRRRTS